MSSEYHHAEIDGLIEVINKCLESYLRSFASEQPKTWSNWISWAKFWYNTTYHMSIGKTHFDVFYGRQLSSLFRFLNNETKVFVMDLEFEAPKKTQITS